MPLTPIIICREMLVLLHHRHLLGDGKGEIETSYVSRVIDREMLDLSLDHFSKLMLVPMARRMAGEIGEGRLADYDWPWLPDIEQAIEMYNGARIRCILMSDITHEKMFLRFDFAWQEETA